MSDVSVRRFEFRYEIQLPPQHAPVRMWVPLALDTDDQSVLERTLDLPRASRLIQTRALGNEVLFLEVEPSDTSQSVSLAFTLERRRRYNALPKPLAYGESSTAAELQQSLEANVRVPTDGDFADQAKSLISMDAFPLEKTRAVFEHILDSYGYDCTGCTPEKGDAVGDLPVACSLKRGTCTDLHGLFVAYLRALQVPARFIFGFNIPRRPEGTIAGYHCWSEVYLPHTGWYPVDVSEALKRETAAEREFYFGNLDENRVQFSVGRDLVLNPAQSTGPLDKLVFPLCESDQGAFLPTLAFRFRDK